MHFLIVKTSSLGDIIHTFPVVDFLKEKFPESKIDWLVEKENAELLHAHPKIDEVIVVNTRAWRKGKHLTTFPHFYKKKYDIAFDFQGNTKSGILLHFIKAKVKVGFGRKTVAEWPNLLFTHVKIDPPPHMNIRSDYLFLPQTYFNDRTPFSPPEVTLSLSIEREAALGRFFDKKPVVIVCPGSRWENKKVSTSTLKTFLEKNTPPNAQFLFAWGNEEEKKLCFGLTLPKLTLPELQYVFRRADLVVAMDSLPLHLAGTTNTPTFSFFGPSLGSKYAPLGRQHQFIQGVCPYNIYFTKRCPFLRTCTHGPCIKNIS